MKTLTILSTLPVAVVIVQADAFAQPCHSRRSAACNAFAESDREKLQSETDDSALLQGAHDHAAGVSYSGEEAERRTRSAEVDL